jgi:uncharacterized protein
VATTRQKHVPQRRCIVCGTQRAKPDLIRIVRAPGGDLVLDAGPKVSGRGAYVCRIRECVLKAAEGKRIARALNAGLSAEQAEALCQLARALPLSNSDGGRQEIAEVSELA